MDNIYVSFVIDGHDDSLKGLFLYRVPPIGNKVRFPGLPQMEIIDVEWIYDSVDDNKGWVCITVEPVGYAKGPRTQTY